MDVQIRPPKFQLVRERIDALIADAEPGTALPTERELATRFGTSRTTVRQALAALTADGRVERTQGSGTYVAERRLVYVRQLTSYSEDLRAQGLHASSRIVSVTKERAAGPVARMLRIEPGEPVHRVERVRLVGDAPLAVEVAHLAGALPRLRRDLERNGSLYGTLRESYGVHLTRSEDVVEAALASPREAQLLELDMAVPVLVIARTAWDADGRPFEFTRSAFRGDRFRFVASSADRQPDDLR